MAADPEGRRSYSNALKLGAPTALLDHDPELVSEIQVCAKMVAKERPSLNNIVRNANG